MNFGSGTDPAQGSSLALSILEYFYNIGAITLATTHYPEIKNYCLITDGFENACVEFDIKTLSPTYKLLIGIPGQSNAFEISKSLGLMDCILDRANQFLKSDSIQIEKLLKNIYDNKRLIEQEKNNIEIKSEEINKQKQSLENELKEIQEKKEAILENAKKEAREMLLDTKEEISNAIHKINNSSSKDLNIIRNNLNNSIKDMYTISKPEKKLNTNSMKIKKGDTVYITNLNQKGIVLTDPNKSNQVQLQVGPAKLNSDIKYLSFISSNSSTNASSTLKTTLKTTLKKDKKYSNEINVIGNNIEDAIFLVDKFLDDCSLSGLKEVRIVHGKGTLALKNGIQNFLKKHPHVKSFRLRNIW